MDQFSAPLAEALLKHSREDVVPFDVPGHKHNLDVLKEYFGEQCVALDLNSRKSIDYLCEAKGVIKQAEQLAADAFGAADAFFMVGGTTSSVQAMIMSACAPGDKILIPRNVHYSVINAVILAGATPVYINPSVHPTLGIALGMRVDDVVKSIVENKDATAIFLNNPTYYGICSDIESIVKIAHQHNVRVLVDEAHGTHFYFNDKLPTAAMHCGADMAAVSMHKTGGSLTQSSILLSSGSIPPTHINNVINLTRTTSASYLLLASLDLARRLLATQGQELLDAVISHTNKARDQINQIGTYWAFGKDIVDGDSVYDFDLTKLSIYTLGTGLAGIELYSSLRDGYGIQIEFGDMNNILAVATHGNSESHYDRLVSALLEISQTTNTPCKRDFIYEYIAPRVLITPREAFYAKKEYIPLADSRNRISAKSVMYYPPGIPILAPGELITDEIISHVLYAVEKGCTVTGLGADNRIAVVEVNGAK